MENALFGPIALVQAGANATYLVVAHLNALHCVSLAEEQELHSLSFPISSSSDSTPELILAIGTHAGNDAERIASACVAVATDAKRVVLLSVPSLKLICTLPYRTSKRVSSLCVIESTSLQGASMNMDSGHCDGLGLEVLIGTSAGTVERWCPDRDGEEGDRKEPDVLLGCITQITCLRTCRGGRFLLSGDRDEKLRVSHFPCCYDIQSYCLGHTSSVLNAIPIQPQDSSILADAESLVLTSSSDGTVRLFSLCDGKQKAVLELAERGKHVLVLSGGTDSVAVENREELLFPTVIVGDAFIYIISVSCEDNTWRVSLKTKVALPSNSVAVCGSFHRQRDCIALTTESITSEGSTVSAVVVWSSALSSDCTAREIALPSMIAPSTVTAKGLEAHNNILRRKDLEKKAFSDRFCAEGQLNDSTRGERQREKEQAEGSA